MQNDEAIQKENAAVIQQAAEQIIDPHSPKIYPNYNGFHWSAPRVSDWSCPFEEEKTKTNVLFLLPYMVMGGADKFNLDLISGLNPEKFETGIITMIPSPNDWLQRFREATPNIFNLPNFMGPEDYAEFISYYIKSRQVDILFLSNAYHGYALVPWLRQQFPELVIVDYVHMEEWYWRAGGYARTSGAIGGITEKTYVCNSATGDVLVSHFGRKPESVETVHIGVDEAYFSADQVQPGKLYQEMGISQDRPIVLFICRMHPQKRPFLMLEIARRTAERVPNVAFAVVGDGPQLEELKNRASDLNLNRTVFFLGARKDVRPYYRDARVSLVCSLKEGLSLTAYESCAMGVPVVSADVGGQKDLIDSSVGALIPCRQTEADSLDARTFPEEEVREYVDAICALLTDSARWTAASKACRERILDGFTIRNMVNYFEEEFSRLTEDSRAMEQRRRVAEALNLCAPIAAETFVLEMQLQKTEDDLAWHMSHSTEAAESKLIWKKMKAAFREGGVMSVLRKAIRYIRKKIL
ncbi:MAG: glycosyltransferase family 4 protein [Eubacteriales bacterium]|nr:glycosyltransferase family 4 protein [Eubacteriales bacterium]